MTGILWGKHFCWSVLSKFAVEIGRGSKGAYKTRLLTNSAIHGVGYYQSVNIGLGYKKRLVQIDGTQRKILARCRS